MRGANVHHGVCAALFFASHYLSPTMQTTVHMTLLRASRQALFAAAFAFCAVAHAAEPIALRLIGINDFHGNLESTGLSLTLAEPAGGD